MPDANFSTNAIKDVAHAQINSLLDVSALLDAVLDGAGRARADAESMSRLTAMALRRVLDAIGELTPHTLRGRAPSGGAPHKQFICA